MANKKGKKDSRVTKVLIGVLVVVLLFTSSAISADFRKEVDANMGNVVDQAEQESMSKYGYKDVGDIQDVMAEVNGDMSSDAIDSITSGAISSSKIELDTGEPAFYIPGAHSSDENDILQFELLDCKEDGSLIYAYRTAFLRAGKTEDPLDGQSAAGIAKFEDEEFDEQMLSAIMANGSWRSGNKDQTNVLALMKYKPFTKEYEVWHAELVASTPTSDDSVVARKSQVRTPSGGSQYIISDGETAYAYDDTGEQVWSSAYGAALQMSLEKKAEIDGTDPAELNYILNDLATDGDNALYISATVSFDGGMDALANADFADDEMSEDDEDKFDFDTTEMILAGRSLPTDGITVEIKDYPTNNQNDISNLEGEDYAGISCLEDDPNSIMIANADGEKVVCYELHLDPEVRVEEEKHEIPNETGEGVETVTEYRYFRTVTELTRYDLEEDEASVLSSDVQGKISRYFLGKYGEEGEKSWMQIAGTGSSGETELKVSDIGDDAETVFVVDGRSGKMAVVVNELSMTVYPGLRSGNRKEIVPELFFVPKNERSAKYAAIKQEQQKNLSQSGHIENFGDVTGISGFDSLDFESSGVRVLSSGRLLLTSMTYGLVEYDLNTELALQISKYPYRAACMVDGGKNVMAVGYETDEDASGAHLIYAHAYKIPYDRQELAVSTLKSYLNNNASLWAKLLTESGCTELNELVGIQGEKVSAYLQETAQAYSAYTAYRRTILGYTGLTLPSKEELQQMDQDIMACKSDKALRDVISSYYYKVHPFDEKPSITVDEKKDIPVYDGSGNVISTVKPNLSAGFATAEWEKMMKSEKGAMQIREEQGLTTNEYDEFLSDAMNAAEAFRAQIEQ